MTQENQKAIIISAPSGSGKTTLVRHMMASLSQLEFSISATTRSPRGSEKNGVDYYFLSVDDFKNRISNNAFTEWEEVYQNQFYGTLKSELKRIWEKGNTVVFDVDVEGGYSLKKIFGDKALSIFVEPPSIEELENRLRSRGTDSEEAIQKRLEKAVLELDFKPKFDLVIFNDDLEQAKVEMLNQCKSFLTK